jgi:hypothetical protein
MLFSLFALLVATFDITLTSLKTGWQSLVVESSDLAFPDEPPTIKLAFAGAVTLSIYALASGYRRRRRQASAPVVHEAAASSQPTTTPTQREAA